MLARLLHLTNIRRKIMHFAKETKSKLVCCQGNFYIQYNTAKVPGIISTALTEETLVISHIILVAVGEILKQNIS